MAVVQPREQPHVIAVVCPPATCSSSLVEVSARRVSVVNESFLFACLFMLRVYAPRRLPFVVDVTAPVILTLGHWTDGRTAGTAYAAGLSTSAIAETRPLDVPVARRATP